MNLSMMLSLMTVALCRTRLGRGILESNAYFTSSWTSLETVCVYWLDKMLRLLSTSSVKTDDALIAGKAAFF